MNITHIAVLLTRDFMKPVLIAIAMGSGIAWYVMNLGVEGFALQNGSPLSLGQVKLSFRFD